MDYSDEIFIKKYLKYKKKYIELKGGMPIPTKSKDYIANEIRMMQLIECINKFDQDYPQINSKIIDTIKIINQTKDKVKDKDKIINFIFKIILLKLYINIFKKIIINEYYYLKYKLYSEKHIINTNTNPENDSILFDEKHKQNIMNMNNKVDYLINGKINTDPVPSDFKEYIKEYYKNTPLDMEKNTAWQLLFNIYILEKIKSINIKSIIGRTLFKYPTDDIVNNVTYSYSSYNLINFKLCENTIIYLENLKTTIPTEDLNDEYFNKKINEFDKEIIDKMISEDIGKKWFKGSPISCGGESFKDRHNSSCIKYYMNNTLNYISLYIKSLKLFKKGLLENII